MYSPLQYWRNYSKTAYSHIVNQMELYKKSGQLFSLTLSPTTGHKIPYLVKFPRLTSDFRNLPDGHYLRYNSEGLFNGLFYVTGNVIPNTLKINPPGNNQALGNPLITAVRASPWYNMYQDAFRHVQDNLRINHQGQIMQNPDNNAIDFAEDPDLLRNSMYINLYEIFLHIFYA